MKLENKIYEIADEVIKKTNRKFIEIAMSEDSSDEKIKFEFFREKYIHYHLYMNFFNNQEFKKLGYLLEAEAATDWKFTVTGDYPKSGRHDIIIRGKNKKPIAGFEIFLGYDKGYKTLNSRSFTAHLNKDYLKLKNDPDLNYIYLLNYFYKGKTERASSERTKRKEKSYKNHLLKCREGMERLVKKHSDKNIKKELSIWLIEARDDGKEALGQLKIG